MPQYTRIRPFGQWFNRTASESFLDGQGDVEDGKLQASEFEKLDQAIYDLKTQVFSLSDYGTDTASIQSAINDCATAGLGLVKAKRGAVYTLTSPGTKTVLNASGSTGNQGYCLSIPSGVYLDFDGATVKKGDSSDAALFMNANPTLTTDHDLGVMNVTMDGNNVALTATALGLFTGCTRLRLQDILIQNGTRLGIFAYNNDLGYYNNLVADTFAGNPFNFGQPFTGKDERRATFGAIKARNITAGTLDAVHQPGNSFYAVPSNCTISSISEDTCDGGVKVQGPGHDTTIAQVVSLDGPTSNCGFKIQSAATRISVGLLTATNNFGSGFFSDGDCVDCSVGTYLGNGNGTSGANADIWLDGIRPVFGTIHSRNAGQVGVIIRATLVDARVATMAVVNPGQVTGGASGSSVGVSVGAGSCSIADLVCVDDQVTRTMLRGISVDSSSAILRVGGYKWSSVASGGAPWNSWAGDDVVVSNPRIGSDKLFGEATPTAAATTTTVSNNNITVIGTYVQPVIEIIAMNAAARTLGIPSYTFSGNTFILHHGSAAGTEVYSWQIKLYRKSVTQAA